MPTKFEALIARDTEDRRRTATDLAARVLAALHAAGIDIRVFGSLARGDFRAHSDVDFLVRGPVTREVRVAVESTLARHFGAKNLPYDVIYTDDLTPAQAEAFDRA